MRRNLSNDETYRKTGVNVFARENCLGIVSAAFNEKIDLEKLFKGVVDELKDKDINLGNIRYIMFIRYNLTDADEAFVISGKIFAENIHDFGKLKEKALHQEGNFEFSDDPAIKKIVNEFIRESTFAREWAGASLRGANTTPFWKDNRQKTYAKNSETNCLAQIEKTKAKASKKKRRLEKRDK